MLTFLFLVFVVLVAGFAAVKYGILTVPASTQVYVDRATAAVKSLVAGFKK